jgi:hypothetical protein
VKRLFKNFASIVLVLPLLGCNKIDFTKLTQNPIAAAGFQAVSSVPGIKNSEKKCRKKEAWRHHCHLPAWFKT